MARLFGTDGVRGLANKDLTADLAYKLGQAGAYVLTAETKHTPKILIGTDTRISAGMLESALVAGICSVGAEAVCLGIIPTPAVAYLTRFYEADAGVVISASHNSYEYNGIKFFDSKGYKLPDKIEDKIEELIVNNIKGITLPTGKNVGTKCEREDENKDYATHLKNALNINLKGLKIVLDCANGAAYKIAPRVFEELGANVCVVNDQPDGININRGCGSTHMEVMHKFVREFNADVGFSFDGDADRVLATDEYGNIIDGDKIMAILALEMKRKNILKDDTIVATVMSNLGLDIMARKEGIKIQKTVVGDRYVLEEMIKGNYSLGGEQSGHIIMLSYNTTGDGILTALKIAEIMKKRRTTMSKLSKVMYSMPQVLINARVNNGNVKRYLDDKLILAKTQELEKEFAGEGRVLIRASGTEPVIRVMIEGNNQNYIKDKAEELANFIEQRLNS